MLKNITGMALIVVFTLIVGCATPLSKEQRDSVRTVAVVNEFPQQPNYAIIGTTIFNNEYDDVGGEDYYEFTSNVTVEYLEKRGYKATSVKGTPKNLEDNYDLVLTLIPRNIYEMPGTNGYGVNQRSFLGISGKPNIYVSLNISPELHGTSTGNAYYKFVLDPLSFEKLPSKWNSLSETQKLEVRDKLHRNIKKAVTELLGEVGL